MELTIEQALQQGVAAHKEGKVQEAERLYRAILQSQPSHPDANHNLGVIAVSVNNAEAALPLFKTALDANPNVEQFWMSYIDALFKNNQVKNAKQAIKKATKKGFDAKKLQALRSQPKDVPDSKLPSQAQLNSLLMHYQNGKCDEAEKLAVTITQQFPQHQFAWKVLGAIFGQSGRTVEAENANQTSVALSPQDAQAHSNLGITLKELGRLDEAEKSYNQAIALKPNFAEAHSNLGNTLQELGRLDEAEASYKQAIALKPDYAEAHYNLGITLQELGRLDESEAGYTQAIALKPDYAEAHSNLGITLQELGRLDEAETSYKQAIALKPDYAEAHYNLGKLLYIKGYKDLALKSVEKANDIDPQKNDCKLLLNVMKSRKSREESETAIDDTSNTGAKTGLTSIPLILNRVVEADLIANLYGMSSRELDKTTDARYGSGKCSPDFNLFQDSCSIIQNLAEDLTRIMKEAVKSEVFIYDSFFNILGAGGGTTPHRHLNDLDKDIGFNLGKQKYSLVYYLSVGDQHCSEPGMLKLYDPVEDILPGEGMITIIPASRLHSAVYGGTTDRIMIGVNFYSL
jgi:tetratricopeptide (TPR) repeat protein